MVRGEPDEAKDVTILVYRTQTDQVTGVSLGHVHGWFVCVPETGQWAFSVHDNVWQVISTALNAREEGKHHGNLGN